jgi:DNA modification methylase
VATAADVLSGIAAWGVAPGCVMDSLRAMPDGCVHCCMTSPPFWGLRDYGHPGQIGLEDTPESFVAALVAVFREVRRVLHPTGTVFLNLGDTYCTVPHGRKGANASDPKWNGARDRGDLTESGQANRKPLPGLKHKDLVGIPWRVAFALQADGWYLRQDIIWHKPSPMPSSVKDRCTTAHEYLFLLTKSPRYFFDGFAIAEQASTAGQPIKMADGWDTGPGGHGAYHREGREKGKHNGAVQAATRQKRSVWKIATKPYKGAHFATFPPRLVEPCVLAGTSASGCCPHCLAPWVRVVKSRRVATRPGQGQRSTAPATNSR